MANAVIELSTAHMTEKDNEELATMCRNVREPHDPVSVQPFNIGEMKYGYCIVVPEDEEYIEESIKECEQLGYELSEDFFKILWHASRSGYRVILFDRDADIVDGLPEHDW